VKWIPNQASHGFSVWETTQPDATGYLGWKQIRKRRQMGVYWVRSRKAEGKFRLRRILLERFKTRGYDYCSNQRAILVERVCVCPPGFCVRPSLVSWPSP
jgi:hypothetical protein